MSLKLANFAPLSNSIVFLDGLGRAGKFLLGKLVSSYEQTEFFQYIPIQEHLAHLLSLSFIDRETTISMMRLYTNLNIYEKLIGRNLNTKSSDSSNILNSHEAHLYLARSQSKEDRQLFQYNLSLNRMHPYLVHECVPFYDLLIEAFPKSFFLNIQRHPCDLAFSWNTRGWGERLGVDPLSFSPFLKGEKIDFPWYAVDWNLEYESLSPIDRIVKSIIVLTKKENNILNSSQFKQNGLSLCYENFFSNPMDSVQLIEKYLNKKPISHIENLLKKEGCFNPLSLKKRKENLLKLKTETSPQFFQELIDLSKQHEKKWNLATIL